MLNNAFTDRLTADKDEELLNSHHRPENMRIASPLLSPEIWSNIIPDCRSADLKIQKLESKLAEAIFCNASLIDSLFMAKNTGQSLDLKQAMRLTMYRRAVKLSHATIVGKNASIGHKTCHQLSIPYHPYNPSNKNVSSNPSILESLVS